MLRMLLTLALAQSFVQNAYGTERLEQLPKAMRLCEATFDRRLSAPETKVLKEKAKQVQTRYSFELNRRRNASYYKDVLNRAGLTISFEDILSYWNEPHRFFHTESWHLNDLLNKIEDLGYGDFSDEKIKLILVALFHDIVYDPRSYDPKAKLKSSELRSAEFFNTVWRRSGLTNNGVREFVEAAILATETHQTSDLLTNVFLLLDLGIFQQNGLLDLYEIAISKEFRYFDYYSIYKPKRLSILTHFASLNPDGVGRLIANVQTREPAITTYEYDFSKLKYENVMAVLELEMQYERVIIRIPRDGRGSKEQQKLVKLFPFHQVISK